jgi:LmbE family N-acetylglucosaminyl deacetylase
MRTKCSCETPARARAVRQHEPEIVTTSASGDARWGRRPLPEHLLGIWAHPDDEAYLSAGLMARVTDAGGSVTLVTATCGEKGIDDPTRFGTEEFAALRRAELTASLRELRVTDVRFLGVADGDCELAEGDVMAARLLEVIDEVRPDTIVTFGPDGITGHPDHRAVSRWTTEAWKRSDCRTELLYAAMTEEFLARHADLHNRLGAFGAYGPQPAGIPTSAVALGCALSPRELERKRRALACHASQTIDLAAAVGEDVYLSWWRDETFVRPAARH